MNVATEAITAKLLGMDPLPANREQWVVTITHHDGTFSVTGVSASCPDAEMAAVAALRSRNFFGDKLKIIADIDVQRRHRAERLIVPSAAVPGSPLAVVRERIRENEQGDDQVDGGADNGSGQTDGPADSGVAGSPGGDAS